MRWEADAVYVDYSGKEHSGIGIVIIPDLEHIQCCYAQLSKNYTSFMGEYMAVLTGIAVAVNIFNMRGFTIYCDNKGIKQNLEGGGKQNVHVLEEACEKYGCVLKWVHGHRDFEYNVLADFLATRGRKCGRIISPQTVRSLKVAKHHLVWFDKPQIKEWYADRYG